MGEFILIKYLKGTLDQESSRKVEEWILLSEENRKVLENLYVVLFINDRIAAKNEIDVNRTFNNFLKQKTQSTFLLKKRRVMQLWKRAAVVAAISIVVLLSGALTMAALLEKNSQSLIVSTKLGERAQVRLPDGSDVWLNAYSRLEYKKTLLSRERKIKLSGEAYFEVAHNKHYPFIVSNEESEIEVLGTKFNVRCNDDEHFISTTLMEGSVLFSNKNTKIGITLKPGEELLFDKNTNEIKHKKLTRPEEVSSWVHGKLFFDNASLEEIARSLEKHYNVHILFNDEEVKQERFNAEFEMADNIYQILSILELTNKFTYKINKRNVIISSREK
ncbi:MAG: DUF4974 domain-containing protein [Bacteroidia bacterium]|nr:DUF4974 domain-containing protein [Bacteroidia bacterium]